MDDEAAGSSAGECSAGNGGELDEIQWRFSQIKGNIESDDTPTDGNLLCVRATKCTVYVNGSADIISCVEFSHDGELLATGDKGGRVVIFQRDQTVGI